MPSPTTHEAHDYAERTRARFAAPASGAAGGHRSVHVVGADATDENPKAMNIRPFRSEDQTCVLDLWTRCGLISQVTRAAAEADLKRKREVQPELFLVGVLGDEVIATAMAGYDGHRGHLYYLAVCPQHQRQGHGRQIVSYVDRLLHQHGCHRLTLFVSNDNLVVTGFYERLGFEHNQVISMGRCTGT